MQEVMRIYRPLKPFAGCCLCAGSCDCCTEVVQVEAPPGYVIGRVRQTGPACKFNYEVQDADGNGQLLIEGSCIMCRCCADVEFPVGISVLIIYRIFRNTNKSVANFFSNPSHSVLDKFENGPAVSEKGPHRSLD